MLVSIVAAYVRWRSPETPNFGLLPHAARLMAIYSLFDDGVFDSSSCCDSRHRDMLDLVHFFVFPSQW
jgi:hypothetical protein